MSPSPSQSSTRDHHQFRSAYGTVLVVVFLLVSEGLLVDLSIHSCTTTRVLETIQTTTLFNDRVHLFLHDHSKTTASPRRHSLRLWGENFTREIPLDCTSFLRDVFAGSSNSNSRGTTVEDPNGGEFYARQSNTSHPFWITLHKQVVDNVRWATMSSGLYYEETMTTIFESILRSAPANARVVDVGGNIGWYTFLSASMKHHVDVFEPLGINLLRQCQSMHLNGMAWWNNNLSKAITDQDEINTRTVKRPTIHIHPYAISDQIMSNASLFVFKSNPGMTQLSKSMMQSTPSIQSPPRTQGASKSKVVTKIPVTTLDQLAYNLGWLEHNKNLSNRQQQQPPPPRTPSSTVAAIVILKIDIENSEAQAIAGAKDLLHSGLVQNILMEVTKGKTLAEIRQWKTCSNLFCRQVIGCTSGDDTRDPTHLCRTNTHGHPMRLIHSQSKPSIFPQCFLPIGYAK